MRTDAFEVRNDVTFQDILSAESFTSKKYYAVRTETSVVDFCCYFTLSFSYVRKRNHEAILDCESLTKAFDLKLHDICVCCNMCMQMEVWLRV